LVEALGFYDDVKMIGLQILTGDCRAVLPTLEAESVQCCVTSPPYWGLRDFGVNGALGLESTPEEYIANMVAVFREVKRVLRDDGTLWLNLGDSYNANQGSGFVAFSNGQRSAETMIKMKERKAAAVSPKLNSGLKPKDLCMMPARVALALQADGWYLRSDIVWHKPNPMPESVTDRPTKAHEYIFLLTKSAKYYYDAEAIREPHEEPWRSTGKLESRGIKDVDAGINCGFGLDGIKPRLYNPAGRNKRSIWTIPTQPYPEAHFATFPEEIPKLCILAGSKPGDTVLDPFAGSGTVGQVALELGRKAILIELNPAYIELAQDRTFVTPGFL
jgi:DNA modification methylase